MEDKLRMLQLVQLEMLKYVDKICRDNDILYSLYAGTMLGAVRHKGFIPWDDDLDICMSRENYDRFIEVWSKTDHSGYVLQNKDNSPDFSQSFTKIRKDHTTFLQSEDEAGKYHTGIFIDIFPVDRIPNGKIRRMMFFWRCMRYQLYTREFVPEKNGLLMKLGSKILLLFSTKRSRAVSRKKLLEKITSLDSDKSLGTVSIETYSSMHKIHSPQLFDNYVELDFEDGKFMSFALWDEMLRNHFGNYMQYPPESERTWKHHPVVLDFDRNLDEVVN